MRDQQEEGGHEIRWKWRHKLSDNDQKRSKSTVYGYNFTKATLNTATPSTHGVANTMRITSPYSHNHLHPQLGLKFAVEPDFTCWKCFTLFWELKIYSVVNKSQSGHAKYCLKTFQIYTILLKSISKAPSPTDFSLHRGKQSFLVAHWNPFPVNYIVRKL